MFHFETSFCVMGDSWWPRNTETFFSRANVRMKLLANLVGFSLDQLVGGEFLAFRKNHRRVIYQLFQWDFT